MGVGGFGFGVQSFGFGGLEFCVWGLAFGVMRIERFEDIEVWKDARELCKRVFELTSDEPFSGDFKFRSQLRGAAGSIMDNIAEGFGRGGNKEFINYLSMAKGSCEEVRSQSYRAFDFQYIPHDTLTDLLEATDKISRKISNFIKYLKTSDLKGPKFKP